MLRFIPLFALLVACKNPNYCADNPNFDCRSALDGPPSETCSGDPDCEAPTAVCDLTGTMKCVQCTTSEHAACSDTKPACGDDHICRGCRTHDECPDSNVCMPDGSCADAGQVAYVQAGGMGTACTKAMPCGTLDAGVKTNQPIVKIEKGTAAVADSQMTSISKTLTIVADPGAKLDMSRDGVILEIRGTADVKIYDLEITGGTGTMNPALSVPSGGMPKLTLVRVTVDGNQGTGIALSAGGSLTVSQSTISNNQGGGVSAMNGVLTVSQSTIGGNQGGGISAMNSTFTIVNNVFFNNGNNTSLAGGVLLGISGSSTNRLDFNSFSLNTTQDGVGPAIDCKGMFTASNNIMSNNRTPTKMDQIAGTCAHTYSDFQTGIIPSGTGNITADPMFINEATGDLHLQAASPVRGKADPAADLTGVAAHDIDGDLRVSPADMGADQTK